MQDMVQDMVQSFPPTERTSNAPATKEVEATAANGTDSQQNGTSN